VRPQQRIAFPHNRVLPEQVRTNVGVRMANLADERFSNTEVVLNSAGHIVLRGQVATEEARKLAEAVARLEPGVRQVQNELIIGTP
jgi:osmotically-inducible protein OsmY